ncbi:exodeoxyribonuclease VII large subunit [Nitrosomonas sp. Is37]|uniref:exodeoxyribonuclease VII large subunit n=1 Tax=Nitrosomonas sp. Is37 TaxID=3080535 RepID=UPI00294B1413|nr:exodeoxyribonuclease VII large subunit [Nitrosomonas sp. Is37]MDV6343438.1 exodeoxyribonuclease VII large subunit [Nitrosomonas sp. Is37]
MNFSFQPIGFQSVLSVTELNRSAREILEHTLPLLWVSGEISNLKQYHSGHWYFSLKDANAQVRCVMFHHKNQYLNWQPKEGMQVEVHALATLYEARGEFQLTVENIRRAGLGLLYEAFERLKAKLEQAGLFNPAHKKTLPTFPRQVGIITSLNTAALHDVLTTLQRRMPALPVIIYPAPVQGEGAAAKIAAAIHLAMKRMECDVLILCRGGGSIEDLWAFNEEIVAQAIYVCSIPIVTGIGHETDFTIADFVADVRAPTPTGAAQIISPNAQEISNHLRHLNHRMQHGIQRGIERRMQMIDLLTHRLQHPGDRIFNQVKHLQHLRERLLNACLRNMEAFRWKLNEFNRRMYTSAPNIPILLKQQYDIALQLRRAGKHRIEILENNLQRQQANLAHLNPQAVLARGYSITYTADGYIVHDWKQIHSIDDIRITFAKGWAQARVTETGK